MVAFLPQSHDQLRRQSSWVCGSEMGHDEDGGRMGRVGKQGPPAVLGGSKSLLITLLSHFSEFPNQSVKYSGEGEITVTGREHHHYIRPG